MIQLSTIDIKKIKKELAKASGKPSKDFSPSKAMIEEVLQIVNRLELLRVLPKERILGLSNQNQSLHIELADGNKFDIRGTCANQYLTENEIVNDLKIKLYLCRLFEEVNNVNTNLAEKLWIRFDLDEWKPYLKN